MEDSIRNLVVSGVVSWTTLFLILKKILPKRSFDFRNRLVSTVHAVMAVFLASLSVQDWRCPSCPLASEPSPSQTRALAVSLSYLIYDLLCSLFDDRLKVDNAVHHVVSILGIGAGLVYDMSGSELVVALWITEISSPFLHLRELLKELGYRDTSLNLAVDILFAIIFMFGRIIYGPYQLFLTLSGNNPQLIKAMALGLQLVSVFWFYKILRMVKHKLIKKSKTT